MAELPDHMPAAAGRGDLRASHADRERVIGTLKAAFVQGRLAKDEFDLRAGQAFAARTYAELAAAIADIPTGLTTPKPPAPARAQGRQPVLRPGRVALAATMLYAGVWVYVILFPMGRDNDTDGELIIVGGFVYLIILASCVGRAAALLEKRSGGQLPQGPASGAGSQASQCLPSADPGRQLPPVDHGHQHTAEAAPRRLLRPWLPGLRSLRRRRLSPSVSAAGITAAP